MSHWIDAHCHLSRLDPAILRPTVERSRKAGIEAWIQGGIDPDDWEAQKRLRLELGAGVTLAFGLHPWWVARQDRNAIDDGLARLDRELANAAALGETGLDYGGRHDGKTTAEIQLHAFEAQLALARSHDKPLVLHVVRAHGEALAQLRRLGPFPRGGIVHSFTGPIEVARGYVELGFLISVGAAATWGTAKAIKATIPLLPADRLVVETDSPDQTPHLSGLDESAANEPAYLTGIAEAVGKLRGETGTAVLDRSAGNLRRLFGI